jgi:Protein of unknown function (DUF2442)
MENDIIVSKVWLDEEYIFIKTNKEEIKKHPISWFPRLKNATLNERNNFKISPFGIHWEVLDEDLSFEGFFNYKKELVK